MKKIYLIPETKVIEEGLTELMAASNPNVTVDPSESINPGDVESRRRTLWDSEDNNDEY